MRLDDYTIQNYVNCLITQTKWSLGLHSDGKVKQLDAIEGQQMAWLPLHRSVDHEQRDAYHAHTSESAHVQAFCNKQKKNKQCLQSYQIESNFALTIVEGPVAIPVRRLDLAERRGQRRRVQVHRRVGVFVVPFDLHHLRIANDDGDEAEQRQVEELLQRDGKDTLFYIKNDLFLYFFIFSLCCLTIIYHIGKVLIYL